MARWKLRKRTSTSPLDSGAAVTTMEPDNSPAPVPAPAGSGATELLGLHNALEEMAQFQTVVAAARTTTPPAPHFAMAPRAVPTPLPGAVAVPAESPGEVTDIGTRRLVRITGSIQAVIEPAADPQPPPVVEAPYLSAWLPVASRDSFEILGSACPPKLAEAFRKLRGRLIEERQRWEAAGRLLTSIAVVSPRRSSGRSATARNLAACLGAAPDAKVLLVDADAGHPSLHRRLRAPLCPGMLEAIAGGDGWSRHIRRVPGSGLYILTLGSPPSGLEAMDHGQLPAFLERLRAEFTWTVLDAPSLEAADGEALAHRADAVLMVLRNEREYFDEAEAAVRRLDPTRLLGAILNFA